MQYTKDQAKEEVRKLVEKYKKLVETGEVKEFNEPHTKREFIEPLFDALNWATGDHNEVTREEIISKKRADFGFRINGIPKFFLEAKGIEEKLEVEHAEQSINYSWLKDVTWAVLTNFVELKIFNAKWKSKGIAEKRFIELTYDEFVDRFEDLWLLSKDAFIDKELDKKAEQYGKKYKMTHVTPVMEQIFNDLMIWREKLTKGIFAWTDNKNIYTNEELLEECVQRILDRLIFIRVCEDRELEPPTLKAKLNDWASRSGKRLFISVLKDVFREFDKNYDGTLFGEHISENIVISDSIISDIINGLYQSLDRAFFYDFSAIDADVLGNIYEEYLGYVLKKGKGKVAANHSHRKEMGIYYTPTFIVDYIVKNSLGRLLKESKPTEVENVKILDMACGSGSFLLKAFDSLINYHRNKNELDFLRKIKILTTNIYGSDIDPKAIEIAQLNLLLKTLEKKRLLPKLQENLKIGNSLLFEWKTEFRGVMDSGRFDIVIGNPPYVDSEEMARSQPELRKLYSNNYESAKGNWDLFCLFLEKGLDLLKDGGYLGMIVPNKLLSADYAQHIRKILGKYKIVAIRDYSKIPVFHASVYPIVIIVKKEQPKNNKIVAEIMESENDVVKVVSSKVVEQRTLEQMPTWSPILYEFSFNLLDRIISQSIKLNESNADVLGAATVSEAYDIKKFISNLTNQKSYFKFINTGTIDRYVSLWDSTSTQYIKSKFIKPVINKNDLKEFSSKRYEQALKKKIIIGGMSKFLECYLDDGKYLAGKSTTIVMSDKINLKVLLAILNSKLMTFCYKNLFKSLSLSGGYMRIGTPQIRELPIKKATEKQEKDIIELVDKILELNKELQRVEELSDKGKRLQEEINRIDKEIDQKVYELYGLTTEEIKIVEETVKD